MKILAYIFAILAIIVICCAGFIFSGFGNDMIAFYVQKAAQEKGVKLEFSKFNIGISKIDINAKINDEILTNISGSLSIFTQKMDLAYNINANNLKSANLNLRNPIDISGQIKGKFSDFDANGAGKGLGSNITFLTNLTNYKLKNLELNAKNLNIDEILALLAKPAYASGQIDLTANVKEQNDKPKGTAEILIYNGIANNQALAKDFNVTLPKNFDFKGAINAVLEGTNVETKSLFITSVATIGTNKTIYDIEKNSISSEFDLNLAELGKLESSVK
ncbi:MAG: hypothetical protein LUC34_05815, partial [Campylobacter sp.]|nr:hypothetical protein [Campylobacter sp.]